MRRLAAAALFAFAIDCAKPAPPVGPFPSLSRGCFDEHVEPELLRSCAFSGCHGAELRPMRIFSLAGVRGPHTDDDVFLSAAEHDANFKHATASATTTSAALPDLLRKPLQLEAGGSGHTGVDRFGRNVYPSMSDPGWLILSDWVNGTGVCTPPDGGAGGGAGGGSGGGGTGGGGAGPTCIASAAPAPNDWATISTFITPMSCNDSTGLGGGCHTQENFMDAGCFLPDSCETVRMGGCMQRSVIGCAPLRSRLWQYAGGIKNHNSKFPPYAADLLFEWIDAGASCDGGMYP